MPSSPLRIPARTSRAGIASVSARIRRGVRRLLAVRVVAKLRDRVRLRTRVRAAVQRLRLLRSGLDDFELSTHGAGCWGALDLPAPGAEVLPDGMEVAGWALSATSPLAEVEVFVNGHSRGLARIGLEREDIVRISRAPHGLLSGFEALVEFDDEVRCAGVAKLLVVARPLRGPSFVVAERTHTMAHPSVEGIDSARSIRDASLVPTKALKYASASDRCWRDATGLALFVVTHDLNLGGAQLWLLELLRRSGAGRAFPCTVRTDTDGPLHPTFDGLGIDVEVGGRTPLKRGEDYEVEVDRLVARLTQGGFTAVLANTFGSFVGADAGLRANLPAVWAIHESWAPPMFWRAAYGSDGVSPAVRSAALSALAACPAVVFESEATRRLYLPWTSPGASVVVPYGVDTDAAERYRASINRSSARNRLGLPEDALVLLMMGTIERRKGQTVLAQAFAEVVKRHPHAYVAFVGDTHSSYANALRRYLANRGLQGRTRIMPVVEDTATWYRASNILVCASDVESLPRSVLDAMSYGTAVLATSVFGIPELITDGETGFLYDHSSLDAAVAALERVLSMDEAEIERVGAAGRALVRRNHHADGYALAIRRLLEDLITERPGVAVASLPPATSRPPSSHN